MMTHRRQALLPTRRSLLSRLKHWDDQESWRCFFDTYWRLIHGVARKAGLTEAESQDVVQETVISVAKQMNGFCYDPARGSFKSWLLQITRRRIADFLRVRYRQVQCAPLDVAAEPHRTPLVQQVPDEKAGGFEALWEDEWKKRLLEAALQRVRRRVDALQYQMFACYVLQGRAPAEVSRLLGVSVGQLYLAKHRVGSLVRKEVQRLEEGLF
jgi:RNA polymerase sigma factor (sigma-70 family)